MEILTKRETVKAERKEARKARKAYKKQRSQYFARLRYLPVIARIIVALALAGALCVLSYKYGTETVSGLSCTQTTLISYYESACNLPSTGSM